MIAAKLLFGALLEGDNSSVTRLVLTGADPNLILPEGASAIHLAAGLDSVPDEIIRLLLQHGAEPNLRSSEGETPLHVSAAYGRCDILRLMLLNGADPDIINQDGQTAADLARQSGCQECMLTLEHFTENIHSEENCQTAFSIEPYEPSLLPIESRRDVSTSSDEVFQGQQGSFDATQISNLSSSSISVFEEDTGSDSDSKEPAIESINSTSSFHTCPSFVECSNISVGDGDISTPRVYDKIPGFKTPSIIPPVKTLDTGTITSAPSCGWFARIFARPATTLKPKPLEQQRPPKCQNQPVSTLPPENRTSMSSKRISNGDNSIQNDEQHKDKLKSLPSLQSNRHDITERKPQLDPLDVSLSSCGSAAFLPTDFDSLELSLNLPNPVHVTKPNPKFGVSFKPNNQKPVDTPADLRENWVRKLHNRKLAKLSVNDFRDDNVPRTSSRNFTDIETDLDSWSLSVINDSRFNRITIGGSLPKNQLPRSLPPESSPPYTNSKGGGDGLLVNCCPKFSNPVPHPFMRSPLQTGSPLKAYQSVQSCSSGSQSSTASSAGSFKYLYTDDEDGYSLVETWYPVGEDAITPPYTTQTSLEVTDDLSVAAGDLLRNDSRAPTECSTSFKEHKLLVRDADSGIDVDTCSMNLIPAEIDCLSDHALRTALILQGFTPGPINSYTRPLYKRKLMKHQINPGQSQKSTANIYLPELANLLKDDLDTSQLQTLEDEMVKPFIDPDPSRKWREGRQKFSFNYLLLDPVFTNNLPARVKQTGESVAFQDFINAIFYIGKGKRARPYAHFKEAIQSDTRHKATGSKVQKILDIWAGGHGVISLHVFQNVIPVEAYTREAAMIEAIGRGRLTNIKAGEYYGVAATWPLKRKRALGVRLLHKTFRIFLSEGERHIRPFDIQGS